MPADLPSKRDLAGIKFRNEFDRAQFLKWLGQLQQRRKHLRSVQPYKDIDISNSLIKRLMVATHPWSVDTYPGRIEMLAWVMGVKPSTASAWLTKDKISPQAARRAAKWLEARALELEALAREFEKAPACFDRAAHMRRIGAEWRAKKRASLEKQQAVSR